MIDDHTRLEALIAGRQPDSGWGYVIIGAVFSFFGAAFVFGSTTLKRWG